MLNEINAFAPIITTLVIAATAIAALVQLRHMRAANHINALWAVQEKFNNADYNAALRYLRNNLAGLMADPSFRAFTSATTRREPYPDPPESYIVANNAATMIGNTIESLGSMIINGLVDRDLFLRSYAWIIDREWRLLEPFTMLIRRAEGGNGLLEDFEYLTVCSRDWMRSHPVSYPRGAARILPSFDTGDASG